jgi:hypothetical protein
MPLRRWLRRPTNFSLSPNADKLSLNADKHSLNADKPKPAHSRTNQPPTLARDQLPSREKPVRRRRTPALFWDVFPANAILPSERRR